MTTTKAPSPNAHRVTHSVQRQAYYERGDYKPAEAKVYRPGVDPRPRFDVKPVDLPEETGADD